MDETTTFTIFYRNPLIRRETIGHAQFEVPKDDTFKSFRDVLKQGILVEGPTEGSIMYVPPRNISGIVMSDEAAMVVKKILEGGKL